MLYCAVSGHRVQIQKLLSEIQAPPHLSLSHHSLWKLCPVSWKDGRLVPASVSCSWSSPSLLPAHHSPSLPSPPFGYPRAKATEPGTTPHPCCAAVSRSLLPLSCACHASLSEGPVARLSLAPWHLPSLSLWTVPDLSRFSAFSSLSCLLGASRTLQGLVRRGWALAAASCLTP